MELALSISLFLGMLVAWCLLPNGPAPAPKHEASPHRTPQEA